MELKRRPECAFCGATVPSATHKVAEFMLRNGIRMLPSPGVPDDETLRQRMAAMAEEFGEFCKALNSGDLVEIADGGADLIYTVYATLLACGMKPEALLHYVADSNLTKEPLRQRDKKGGKGPSYVSPRNRIIELLGRQRGHQAIIHETTLVSECSCKRWSAVGNDMDKVMTAYGRHIGLFAPESGWDEVGDEGSPAGPIDAPLGNQDSKE